jgi:hypothetical protein
LLKLKNKILRDLLIIISLLLTGASPDGIAVLLPPLQLAGARACAHLIA